MFHPHAKCVLTILFLLGAFTLSAQTSTSSNPLSNRDNNPYSKYGIGELQNGNSTVLKGMGNTTSAFENPYEINSDNPASYPYLKRTTFEAGMTASTRNVNAMGSSYTTGTATLSYLTIGIPVNKNAGLCFGFKPYSHSFYALVDTLFTAGSPLGETIRSYTGDGGLNYAYVGAAYKYKDFSIGFNGGYMFGTIQSNTEVTSIDTVITNRAYTANYANYNRLGGLYWKAGLMWEHNLDSNYTLRIGGTLTLGQSITERLSSYQVSIYNFGDTLVNDTSASSGEARGKLKLPMSYSIGAMLMKDNKWGIGVDFTATQWSQFNSQPDTNLNHAVAKGSYKASFGFEFTPDANSIRSYYSKVTYRAGLYYGMDYLTFQNTQLPVYGVTLGASLPFRRSFSHLHTSLDIGRIGTTANNLIQETYVRFSLGMSFNDLWFIKRKYE